MLVHLSKLDGGKDNKKDNKDISNEDKMKLKISAFETIYNMAKDLKDKNKELSSTLEKIKKGELIPFKENNIDCTSYDGKIDFITDITNNSRAAVFRAAYGGKIFGGKLLYPSEKFRKNLDKVNLIFGKNGIVGKYYSELLGHIGLSNSRGRVSPDLINLVVGKEIRKEFGGISKKNYLATDSWTTGKSWQDRTSFMFDANKKTDCAFDDILIHTTDFINYDNWIASSLVNKGVFSVGQHTGSQLKFACIAARFLNSQQGKQLLEESRNRNVTIDEVGKLFAKEILKEAQKAVQKKSPYKYTDLISPEAIKKFALQKEINDIKQPNNIDKNNMSNNSNKGGINKINEINEIHEG